MFVYLVLYKVYIHINQVRIFFNLISLERKQVQELDLLKKEAEAFAQSYITKILLEGLGNYEQGLSSKSCQRECIFWNTLLYSRTSIFHICIYE